MLSFLGLSAYPAAKVCLVLVTLLLYWNLLHWFQTSDMNIRDRASIGGVCAIILAVGAVWIWLWINARDAAAQAPTTPNINNNSGNCNGANNCNGSKLEAPPDTVTVSDPKNCPAGFMIIDNNSVIGLSNGATGYKIYQGARTCFVNNKAVNVNKGSTGYDIGEPPPPPKP